MFFIVVHVIFSLNILGVEIGIFDALWFSYWNMFIVSFFNWSFEKGILMPCKFHAGVIIHFIIIHLIQDLYYDI